MEIVLTQGLSLCWTINYSPFTLSSSLFEDVLRAVPPTMPAKRSNPNHLLDLNFAKQSAELDRSTVLICKFENNQVKFLNERYVCCFLWMLISTTVMGGINQIPILTTAIFAGILYRTRNRDGRTLNAKSLSKSMCSLQFRVGPPFGIWCSALCLQHSAK